MWCYVVLCGTVCGAVWCDTDSLSPLLSPSSLALPSLALPSLSLSSLSNNKGAAVIRLQLYDTTFCFISAHLSAHRKNVGDRNADFHRIIESTHFRELATAPEQEYHEYVAGSGPSRNRSPPTSPPRTTSRDRFQSGSVGLNGRRDLGAAQTNAAVGAGGGQVAPFLGFQHGSPGRTGGQAHPTGVLVGVKGRKAKKDHGGKGKKTVGILDHDFVFWVGDLNYRMMDDINIEEVYRRIDAREVKMLRSFDQLTTVRAMGQAFSQFTEAPIDFLPTFKVCLLTGVKQYSVCGAKYVYTLRNEHLHRVRCDLTP